MGTLIIAILILGFMVFVHEFGHFITAKISGMRVEEFSIGMGPHIYEVTKGDTLYSLRIFPFGGYVRVTGEAYTDEAEESTAEVLDADDPRRYPNRPIWQRFIFCLAGSGMNYLTALVLFTAIICSMGIADTDAVLDNEISIVSPDSAAAEAGLTVGDKIIAVESTAVATWEEMSQALNNQANGEPMTITVEHNGETKNILITPQYDETRQSYLLGISKSWPRKSVGLGEGLSLGFQETVDFSKSLLHAVKRLMTGEVSVTDENEGLTGPVGIVMIIDEFAQEGFLYLVSLTAMLSLNLAVFNLLPIPGLDGSKILFLLIEAVRGRKVAPEKENLVNMIGFVFIMGLVLFVTYNDILRLFK